MVGKTFGKYEIIEKLGEGGMGEVYLARDTKLCRSVALKFFSAQRGDAETALKRFVREARAAANLEHPNIGTIFDVGRLDGQPFIAMAYYRGQTLRQRIEAGALPVREARSILKQIASGLAAAHKAGVVHRDLKPANILLTSEGPAKILDFGLAKVKGGGRTFESGITQEGVLLGTVNYMSPEQARGEETDHRTDLWSLGVIAYEMLSGSRPFDADSMVSTIGRIANADPKPLEEIKPETPDNLVRLVEGMLEKDPDMRPQNADEVVKLLAEDSVVTEIVPGRRATLRRRARRRKLRWGAVAVATAAVLIAWMIMDRTGGATSVVALPAKVMGPVELEFLTDAVSAGLSTYLGRVPGLEIRMPPSSFEYEKVHGDLDKLTHVYKVRKFIVSSIMVDADDLVLNLQLVDAKTRRVQWTREVTGTSDSYVDLIRHAAEEVCVALVPNAGLPQSPLDRAYSSKAELEFRRGQYLSNRYNNLRNPSDLEAALKSLKESLVLAPNLAEAAGEIAMLYVLNLEAGGSVEAGMPEIETWAERALAVDPRCSQAWNARAFAQWYQPVPDHRKQLEYGLKAAAFGHRDAIAQMGLTVVGCFSLEIAAESRAAELDPLYLYGPANLAASLYQLGRTDEALDVIDGILQVEPEMPYALWVRSLILSDTGKLKESAAILDGLEKNATGKIRAEWLALARDLHALSSGDPAKAREAVKKIQTEFDAPDAGLVEREFVVRFATPRLTRLGHRELALHILEKGSEIEGAVPYDGLCLIAEYRALKGDPRFEAVMRRSKAGFEETLRIFQAARAKGEFPPYLEAPLADVLEKIKYDRR